MEDLHHAGGLPTLLRELKPLLHLDAMTVTGRTLGEEIDAAPAAFAQDVVRPFAKPLYPQGGIAVLRGNLAPGGAIIKQSAADPKLMQHEGRAVVFENAEDLAKRIDSDDLDVRAEDILVLKNIGPKGAPGMPEAGYLPIPKKLARAGVKDMVRISDGRMSGTAAGTIVLHVTPEAATGGPLAWVQSGDRIRLDVAAREIALLVERRGARQAQTGETRLGAPGRAWLPQALPRERHPGRQGRRLRIPPQGCEAPARSN
jgi:dihydroxy-acid dehydratase